MEKRFTIGATNQSITDIHNIKLCGKPCPTKYPIHKNIINTFKTIAIVFKFRLLVICILILIKN